jgi:O-antigen/teichoic acid export membrane protein
MNLKSKISSIFNHEGFKKYFINTSWLMLDKILRIFLGLFVGVWVARYLGPENYGILSFSMSFVGLFGAFSKLGLDGIIVRNIIQQPEQRDEILGTSLILKLVGSIILVFCVWVALHFTSTSRLEKIIVLVIAFGQLFMSFEIFNFYFQSQVKGKYSGISATLGLLSASLVRIFFILAEFPLIWFAVAVFIENLVKIPFYIYFYKKFGFLVTNFKFSKNTAKNLLSDSWPFIFTGLILMVQAGIDQVMLKEMVDSKEVGLYSVAMRLISFFGFLPVMLKESLFPAIQNAKKHSSDLYKNRLVNFYRLNCLLFFVVAIPIFCVGDDLVVLLYGDDYRESGVLLSLMAVRLFFANMGVARGVFILLEGLMRYSLIPMILGTLANIFLNYCWIPIYGGKGAIFATILSFAITIFVIDCFYKKTRYNVWLQFYSFFTFFKIQFRS